MTVVGSRRSEDFSGGSDFDWGWGRTRPSFHDAQDVLVGFVGENVARNLLP